LNVSNLSDTIIENSQDLEISAHQPKVVSSISTYWWQK